MKLVEINKIIRSIIVTQPKTKKGSIIIKIKSVEYVEIKSQWKNSNENGKFLKMELLINRFQKTLLNISLHYCKATSAKIFNHWILRPRGVTVVVNTILPHKNHNSRERKSRINIVIEENRTKMNTVELKKNSCSSNFRKYTLNHP